MILRSIAGLFALGLFASTAWTDTLRVVDEGGNPVANAVVSVSAPGAGGADSSATDTAIMDQINRAFVPHVLIVGKNQAVKFPNSDNIRHHVYSFSQPNNFEIKLYSGEPSAPVVFEYPGIVVLGCNIHDRMKGYIYVADQERAGLTGHEGLVELELGSADQVTVWHSRLKGGSNIRETLMLENRDQQGNWLLQIPVMQENSRPKSKFRERYR